MAIGAVRRQLGSTSEYYDKYVLDADIKGFFDNISHEWLLNHVPLEITLKTILKKWFKAGSVYLDKEVEYGESGTPEGGFLSPTLANHTLNGLEAAIEQAVATKYKVRKRGIYIGNKPRRTDRDKTKYRFLSTQLATIRYADDFIVLGRSRRMIEEAVRPAVEKFLKERGLTLSPEKTKVLSIRGSDPVDFLGYTFKYFPRISHKYGLFHDNTGRAGIACYPQKNKVKAIAEQLKKIISQSINLNAYELIAKLNPIIRGWAQYFHLSQSYQARNRINSYLYRRIWAWAKRKHPKWGKKKIALSYFIRDRRTKDYTIEIGENRFGNSNRWVFNGRTRNESIYKEAEDGKTIELLNPTKIIASVRAGRYRIPEKLELIHAYHPDNEKLIDFNFSMSKIAMQGNNSYKAKLLIRQKGKCGLCGTTLLDEQGEFQYDGSSHIHHKEPRAQSGSRGHLKNMMLVHARCH